MFNQEVKNWFAYVKEKCCNCFSPVPEGVGEGKHKLWVKLNNPETWLCPVCAHIHRCRPKTVQTVLKGV